ncbi:hypothetical protein B296_00007536 [Ensete ventricosum]|uniref:Uncharacterized protein n=1 Tax=Ensete ventricosum TaxID=4639 RepID=A0A427A1K1_ENSVE|nr:hypothetical protein B296_00007536 [Ensete ventricosum]
MSLEHGGLGGDEIVEAGFLAEELGGSLVVVPMVLELGLGEDGIPGFLVDDDDSGTLVPQWSFRAFRFARLMMMGFEKLPELIPVAVALELLSMGWKAERVSSEKKSVVVVVLEVLHRISSTLTTATATATATRNRKANVNKREADDTPPPEDTNVSTLAAAAAAASPRKPHRHYFFPSPSRYPLTESSNPPSKRTACLSGEEDENLYLAMIERGGLSLFLAGIPHRTRSAGLHQILEVLHPLANPLPSHLRNRRKRLGDEHMEERRWECSVPQVTIRVLFRPSYDCLWPDPVELLRECSPTWAPCHSPSRSVVRPPVSLLLLSLLLVSCS